MLPSQIRLWKYIYCVKILSRQIIHLKIQIRKLSQNDLCKEMHGDFPGGTVVKNPPANAGDMGLRPGPGGSHMPRSN